MMCQVSIREHNEMVLKDLEEGDLVQFDRGIFSHWGVYVGDEKIVHLVTGGNSISGSSFSANYSSNSFSCSSFSEDCSSNERKSSKSTSGLSSSENCSSKGKESSTSKSGLSSTENCSTNRKRGGNSTSGLSSSENCSSKGKESSNSTSGSSSFGNGISNGKGLVIMEPFWTVAKDSRAMKNNHLDTSLKPLPKEEIMARATGKIGTHNYNVIWNNCENFATWCRNGKNWSKQAEKGLEIATIVGAIAVILLSLMGLMKFGRRN